MTADLLTLNTSKTEFLLNGLKQQLAKIQNCTLNTTHSARNLGFIFGEHLTFSVQISALSCYSHIHELRCIRPYLDFKTANTIATSIAHSKLDYCNSLYYNLRYSQLNRLQQIQNCLACAVFKAQSSLTLLLFLNLYTGSKSIIVFSIRFFLLSSYYCSTWLSPKFDLCWLIFIVTRSSSSVTLSRPSLSSSLKSLTAHFVMHLLAFGINFLPHSVNRILIILFLTLLNRILLALLPHHHHFHCPSLLLFYTLNSKDTFSFPP